MKLSDYVASFLKDQGIGHVFAVTGGASLHLIDSIARTPGIEFVCPQHEQGGAMAADAYSRATGNLGCALATSGPGATNLVTGIICSWFDSVPVFYLTGQVTTFRLKGDSGVRQLGFQETEIVEMCKPVTKYAVMVTDWKQIRYEMEKAVHIAKAGRPGPVLVDIPDDLQRMDIDPSVLVPFVPPPVTVPAPAVRDLDTLVQMLAESRRPVMVLGWGVRLAGAGREAVRLAEQLGIPVLPTWPALDLLPASHPQLVGPFGTHGTRYANYALQNADLVLSIGARLDTREAGSPYQDFARGARKVVVDIDPPELHKLATFGMTTDLLIHADARQFVTALLARTAGLPALKLDDWYARIAKWKRDYPICTPEYRAEEALNPYVFIEALSAIAAPGELLAIDTGCALAWTCQAFQFKEGQRLFHCFNTTAMGYALPAAIGVAFAEHQSVTCVVGDGSLQMNIQELATMVRHQLPIRVFLINNHGYSMVQQTQEQWLGGRYSATTVEGGLGFPDFAKVAEAYGIRTVTIDRNDHVADKLREVYGTPGPVFCNVEIAARHRVVPQVKFGRPIEDGEPLLPRAEFFANMIVAPTPASQVDHEEPSVTAIQDEGKS
ncbi:MAG: thiamine pyrophosphate-binding protein [Vicinamibacterales bacterium]|nr:thiamine pyrophosphate-binding protein [Vicinamibacterales bacterium]